MSYERRDAGPSRGYRHAEGHAGKVSSRGRGYGDISRDATSEQRVFVGNLPFHTAWTGLKDFLKDKGYNVAHVRMITERATGRPAGCAVVEFTTVDEARHALANLNGSLFSGRELHVREDKVNATTLRSTVRDVAPDRGFDGTDIPTAEHAHGRWPQDTERRVEIIEPRHIHSHSDSHTHAHPDDRRDPKPGHTPAFDEAKGGYYKVHVGNLAFSVSWQDLKDFFNTCAPVSRVDVANTKDGRSAGWAVVEFENADGASKAVRELHDKELNGRPIVVRLYR